MAVLQREFGRRSLLKHIRLAGQIPRIELADQTGISRATVTTITAELLQHGLIEEVARPENGTETRRGRPRVDLKIRGQAHLIAGGKISGRRLSFVLLDFEGQQLATLETDMDKETLPCSGIADAVASAVAASAMCSGVMSLAGVDIRSRPNAVARASASSSSVSAIWSSMRNVGRLELKVL